ncbi:hypothetical protein DFH06DRAFT_1140072 [Mycena polygramma]|nr:hypothetical protein DFH06DRAFT_1140072 [Mycena polygramma]
MAQQQDRERQSPKGVVRQMPWLHTTKHRCGDPSFPGFQIALHDDRRDAAVAVVPPIAVPGSWRAGLIIALDGVREFPTNSRCTAENLDVELAEIFDADVCSKTRDVGEGIRRVKKKSFCNRKVLFAFPMRNIIVF